MSKESFDKDPIRVTKRGKRVAVAVGTLILSVGAGIFATGGDSDADSSPARMIQIQAPDNGTAWDLAKEIKTPDSSLREVSDIISKQADAQGYQGVDYGEVYELPASVVSKEAADQYAVAPNEER